MTTPVESSFAQSDEQARQRIRTSLDESLIVEAAAGTGKTSELVRRIVAILRSGRTTVDHIVAVTFTRKAASELRLRLRIELDGARSTATANAEIQALEHASSRLEEAQIGTIHAFCAETLRQRPVEAHIPPGFEELDEDQAGRLYTQAFDEWVQNVLEDPTPGVRRILSRTAVARSDETGSALHSLRSAGWKLIEWRDFPASWHRPSFERDRAIDALVIVTAQFAADIGCCEVPSHPVRRHLQCVIDFELRRLRAEESRPRDYDRLESMLSRLLRDLRRSPNKGSKKYSAKHARDEMLALRDQFISQLEQFEQLAGADLAAELQEELRSLVERYESLKARAGKLDFVDLLVRMRDLLRHDASVRQFLQNRFSHIFVDEFQDTDPVQAEILLLLATANPDVTDWRSAKPVAGKLFLVGDPKQSIYRFRRADIIFYQQVRQILQDQGTGLVYLSRSFRSVKTIQCAINGAFAREMTGNMETGQPAYVPLDLPNPAPACSIPAPVIALPVPFPYGAREVANYAIERCLPATVAAFIQWLLHESGWQVRNPESSSGELVPVASRHIAILFRRFISYRTDMTREYVRELESRDIPHLLWGARSFHEREEVEAIRAALNAIEWPDDELSLYAVLKGSLFAIPDSLLFHYRHERGRLNPFHPAGAGDPPEFKPISDALELFADLHRHRNRRSTAESIHTLLNASRAHPAFALRPAGNQVLMNVYRIAELARRYESSGGISFRGFVEHLNAQAEREDRRESPVLEEAADGVRIMTVHEAKGLEFPVVIAADMTARVAQDNADKHVDTSRQLAALQLAGCVPWNLLEHAMEEHLRDEAEGVRIAYVAATRARDLLVVPAIGDGPRGGWLQALNKVLYPPKGAVADVSNIPVTGTSTVLQRPMEYDGSSERSVKPGVYTMPETGHSVAWWDPLTLNLNVPPRHGLHLEEILTDDKEGRADRGVERYGAWQKNRESRIEAASVADLSIFTATDAPEPPAGYASRVQVSKVVRHARNVRGPRFGTLVHALFRDSALGASSPEIETLAIAHRRLLAATEEEVDAAVTAVASTFSHPLMQKAAASSQVHRELPVAVRVDENTNVLAEGVIDFVFFSDNMWIVIDFKTDADSPQRREKYQRQVAWYVYAMERATNQRTIGWLLHV